MLAGTSHGTLVRPAREQSIVPLSTPAALGHNAPRSPGAQSACIWRRSCAGTRPTADIADAAAGRVSSIAHHTVATL